MTEEEKAYFARMPSMLPAYTALREKLEERFPGLNVKVSKTQISFRSRYIFAMVSLPWRKNKQWPEEYLLVSFGLSYQKQSPRIVQAVEAYPNRWTHHVLVETREQIDDELLDWLEEAYHFSMVK